MEQSFADLLNEAFSDTSSPSLDGGESDFEKLNFDQRFDEETSGISDTNSVAEEDGACDQEADTDCDVSQETVALYTDENVNMEHSGVQTHEEDLQGVGAMTVFYPGSDDSDQEGSVSGEEEDSVDDDDDDVGSGGFSMPAHYEFCDKNKEDTIFAEGPPLAPMGPEYPEIRNKEQSESDEEVFYFGNVPERGSEMVTKGDGTEEDKGEGGEKKQEDSSDSEREGMKSEPEEDIVSHCSDERAGGCHRDGPDNACLDFLEISEENLQDLIAAVETEQSVAKVKDFCGEEHQEAGESFADYPSDLSSCEYVEKEEKHSNIYHRSNDPPCISDISLDTSQNTHLEGSVADIAWMGRAEDEEGGTCLYSRDLKMGTERWMNLGLTTRHGAKEDMEEVAGAAVTGCDDGEETDESDTHSSSDDEVQVRRGENNRDLENSRYHGGSGAASSSWSISEDHPARTSCSISWTVSPQSDLFTTDDTDETEPASSGVTRHYGAEVKSYSAVESTQPFTQGSLDDSFFFNAEPEAFEITEMGQLGDDTDEEERNWEQEQERIKAFYKFYDNSDEDNGAEGRRTKVQFCTDPLSQVIHYESDSTDRESVSSFADDEEDVYSAGTSEDFGEPAETLQMKPFCDLPDTQQLPHEPDHSNTQCCTRTHKCLDLLKLTLKMVLVILMGLLMFQLATERHLLSQFSFF